MNNQNEKSEYKLSPEERAEMRTRVRLFMAEHPVQPTALERFAQNFAYRKARRSYFRPALAGALIVMLVGSGTSYAAADALPGEFLYAIKTKVNEPLASTFALTPEAKASVSAELAVKRIEEAEVLASKGRLSPEVRVELESKFEEHVADFEKKTALAEEEDAIEEIADVQSNLEASLRVHAVVLAELSTAIPGAEKELNPIQRKVAAHVAVVESARVTVESTISAKADKKVKEAAEQKKRIVEREASGRRVSVSARTAKMAEAPEPEAASMTMTMMMAADSASDAGIAATATDAVFDPVIEGLEMGSAAFEGGQYGEAFTKFQGAIRALKQEEIDEDVRKKLKFNWEPEGEDSWNGEDKGDRDERVEEDEKKPDEERNESSLNVQITL